jgi:hypothetical protein
LNCIPQADGSYALKTATDVRCFTSEYSKYLSLIVVANLLYTIGVPLAVWLILLRAHRKGAIGTPAFDYRFGALSLPFTPECWWFELVSTLRKLLLVVAVQFLGRDNSIESLLTQLMMCISIFVAFALLQVVVSPYRFVWNNRLSLGVTVTLLFFLFSGLLYSNSQLSVISKWYTAVVTVLIIVACLLSIAMTLVVERRRALQRSISYIGLGLNRYQVAAMERRLLERMFPDSAALLSVQVGQMAEDAKDLFLQNCLELLRLMPSEGLDPFYALRKAKATSLAAEASVSELSGVAMFSGAEGRLITSTAVTAPAIARSADSHLLWTGRQVEMVSLTQNPLSSLRRSDSIALAHQNAGRVHAPPALPRSIFNGMLPPPPPVPPPPRV